MEISKKKSGTIKPMVKLVGPKWIAPVRGCAKINVDAAVRKQGRIGAVAAVCRSEEGVFLGPSAVVTQGNVELAVLEALACREALALVADLYEGDIVVTTDCMEVVQRLQGENPGLFSHILKEIKTTARLQGGVSFPSS